MSFPTLSGSNDQVGVRGGFGTAAKATINASSNGANTIVAAIPGGSGVPGSIIRVVAYLLVVANDVTVTWESSGGTILGGPTAYAANGGAAPPYCPLGHFDTLAGEGLVLFLGSGVAVGGHVTYIVLKG